MNTEEVIIRRLLIDGDGTGDDRRLNALLKTFNKWCNSSNDTENHIIHDRMVAQLAQCEFAVKKSQLAGKMSARELEHYEKISEEIKSNIDSINDLIETSKTELKHAKVVRKNKMEYDVLAKIINEQPDRKNTDKKLADLKNELASLEEKNQQLESKMDMRRKQFLLLISSVNQLRTMVETADSGDIMDIALDTFDDDLTEIGNSPGVEMIE